MLNSLKTHFLVFLVLVGLSLPAVAQNGGFAGASLRLGFGPRAMSMANAATATTSEGIYPYYNPALAAEITNFVQTDLTASSLQFDRIYQNAGAHFKLPPNAGIYIGLIRSGVKNIDKRSLSGYPLGTDDLSEYQLLTSFGLRFNPNLQGGISFKISYANYHQEITPATAVGVDLGLLYKLSPTLNFGFSVQDLFAAYTWNSGDLYGLTQSRNVINTFPTRFKWAFSYQQKLFTVAAEYEVQSLTSEVPVETLYTGESGIPDVISSLETIHTNTNMVRMGGAWKAHERFTLRAGYQITDLEQASSNSFSSGFSIHLPFDTFAPSIDYAFVREPYGVANMHVFALRLHL